MHQVTDRRGVFRRIDGVVTHHTLKALHRPSAMKGEDLVEEGFDVGKGAGFMHEAAPGPVEGPFCRTGIEAIVFFLETSQLIRAAAPSGA